MFLIADVEKLNDFSIAPTSCLVGEVVIRLEAGDGTATAHLELLMLGVSTLSERNGLSWLVKIDSPPFSFFGSSFARERRDDMEAP